MATQSSLAKHDPPGAAEPAARPSLTLTRRFSAAPEKVYAAWADPQKLVQWFGPGSVEEGSVRAEIDLRVGGRYRISFRDNGGRWSRTVNWSLAGHGTPRRSGNRW
jgi:uncharacterized protein YndB with AHSA1/START domain